MPRPKLKEIGQKKVNLWTFAIIVGVLAVIGGAIYGAMKFQDQRAILPFEEALKRIPGNGEV